MDNERLEFLGDAVLELGISEYLYNTHFKMPEGEMTKLRATIVCEESLYNFSKVLNFNEFIRLGRGEEQTGGRARQALLADVFEAFRSEEHTSELQSRGHLECRLLLEK